MQDKNSVKLKSSKKKTKLGSSKKQNVKTVEKSYTPNLNSDYLDILDEETWGYMNEIGDLKYEY